jgi:hypothetical protein
VGPDQLAQLGQTSLASIRKADYVCVRLGGEKIAAVFPWPASAGSKDDRSGTVSKTEPPVKQDGTPAHPFADANQCPSNTDLIIWPSGRSVPSLPPSISVCFVGNQSFKDGDSGVHVRQR